MTTKELKIQRALGLLDVSDMSLEQLLRFRNKLERDNENLAEDFDTDLYQEVLDQIEHLAQYVSFSKAIDLLDRGLDIRSNIV